MILTEILPRTLDSVDLSDSADAARSWIDRRYELSADRSVRVNMIASLTGSAVGPDGTSETLTGGADRLILGVIRARADVVLVGAETVRSEGYILPRSARLAIVTESGDIRGPALEPDAMRSRPTALVLCPAERESIVRSRLTGKRAEIVAISAERLTPHVMIDALADLDLHHIVCEGGPALATQFAETDVVDEFCLTAAPTLTPARRPMMALTTALSVSVVGMLVDEAGFTYLRVRPRGRRHDLGATE